MGVSVLAVEVFELVDVTEQQRSRLTGACRHLGRARKPVVQDSPVGQPGEGVSVCLVDEELLA